MPFDLAAATPPQGSTSPILLGVAMSGSEDHLYLASALAEKEPAQLLSLLLEAAPDAVVVVERSGRIRFANSVAERLFKAARGELLGLRVEMLVPADMRNLHVQHRNSFEAEPGKRFMGAGREMVAARLDGSTFHAEIALSPLPLRDELLTIAAVRDITSRRLIEHRLREALVDKDLLMREVHHRVKNNLQLVGSLLALQSSKVAHPTAQEALEDCRQRILGMALVQDKLYGSADLRRIDLKELTHEIAAMLITDRAGPLLATSLDVEPLTLDIDRSLPVVLLLNELITNALKHAFAGRERGRLTVRVKRTQPDRLSVEVADDGVGGMSIERLQAARTLGSTIIRNLVRQLDAELSVRSGPGTQVIVRVPLAGGRTS